MNLTTEIIKKSLKDMEKICSEFDTSPVGSFLDFRKIVFDACIKINTEIALKEKQVANK